MHTHFFRKPTQVMLTAILLAGLLLTPTLKQAQAQIDASLTWNTFLGGDETDQGIAVAVDDDGNIYVGGFSDASWQGSSPPIRAHSGSGFNNFVAKLDSSGNLLWNTFLGASDGTDYGVDIAVDDSGNVYVVGVSISDWGDGECTDCPIRDYSASADAFAAMLDTDGTLLWNTFLGGTGIDTGLGIDVDGSGNVYVTGYSNNVSGADPNWGGGSPERAFSANDDCFAAELNSGGALQWYTFLGGSSNDIGKGVTVNDSGQIYVIGDSTATWGNPERGYTANSDAFAARLNSSGALQWNTFLGGAEEDVSFGIVTNNGAVYIVGHSNDGWAEDPIRDHNGDGNYDAFAADLNSNGELQWHTFLGGAGIDYGLQAALDENGNIDVIGTSIATWGEPDEAHHGNYEAFVSELASDGQLRWNTFVGGSNEDYGTAITTYGDEDIYVTGYSTASWGDPIRAYTDDYDAFAAYIFDPVPDIAVLGNGQIIPNGSDTPSVTNDTDFGPVTVGASLAHTFTISNSGNLTLTVSSIDLSGSGAGDFDITGIITPAEVLIENTTTFNVIFEPSAAGVHMATVSIENDDMDEDPYTFVVQGLGNSAPIADAGEHQTVPQGALVQLDGSGSSDPDGDDLTYGWMQTGGLPAMTLDYPDTVTPTFTATDTGVFTFTLTVTDIHGENDSDEVYITVINTPPIADAGEDRTIAQTVTTQLDGTGSYDPDGHDLSYAWIQTGGSPAMILDDNNVVTPTFTVTDVGVFTFTLTVTDTYGLSDSDEVAITVINTDTAPIADAGEDQIVIQGENVQLDGTGSSDPDQGDELTYEWTQTGGAPVMLLDDNISSTPSFTATHTGVFTFTLTVADMYELSDSDEVIITVINHAPIADAGDDQSVPQGRDVQLDGTGSNDPDDHGLTFEWIQTGGSPAVTLNNSNAVTPTFTASELGVFTFTLTVTDTYGLSDSDEVAITVTDDDLEADLAISKELMRTTNVVTYTVSIINLGPDAADGALVHDQVNTMITDVTWTCEASNGAICANTNGSGNLLHETITQLPNGGMVVFTITGQIALLGDDLNIASVHTPDGVIDPNPENNEAMAASQPYRAILPLVFKDYNMAP